MVHEGGGESARVEKPAFPANRSPQWRSRLLIAAFGVTMYGMAGLAARFPDLVESLYSARIAPPFVWMLSRITGFVPFSITELIYVGYAAFLLRVTWVSVRNVISKQRSIENAVVCGATRLVRDAGIVVLLFYTMWGFNYARPNLETRVGWPAWSPGDVEELTRLATELVEEGNRAYLAIHDTSDVGSPTTLPNGMGEVHAAIESSWARVVSRLDLPESMARRYGKTKYIASSAIYARLGITGFYFPFTAEANVRWGLPALSFPQSSFPQSVAHEKAHQRGIASEDEASFLGFVAGALSDDSYVRYSSIMFAQRQLAAALARADRERWRGVARRRLPGVQRDLEHLSAYFRRFVGVGTTVGRSVNDRFLRANRMDELHVC